jgi:glutamyl/glutaminyl-tRNA synthetase
VFDERKLRHMNGEHLRELGIDELTRRLEAYTGRSGLRGAVEISAEKIQTLADFWPLISFVFDGPVDDPAAFQKTICREGGIEALEQARQALAGVSPFTPGNIEAALRGVVERRGGKPGQVFQPVRVAIAGQTVSPGIFETLALIGSPDTLARIDQTLLRARGDEGCVPQSE